MLIQIDKVKKTYKMGDETIIALDDISLKIEDGSFIAIVGPSGSGKSTLMHIIGALDRPDKGVVSVSGIEITDKNLKEKEMARFRNEEIGFVFQTFNLEPTLTALENVELPLIISDESGKTSRAMARLALKKVGLGKRMEHKPSELSGGERQRVAIARAIVNEPKVILADEPTGNLDSKTGGKIVKLLKDLSRKDHVTVIMVTHNLEIAQKADNIIHIHDGKLINK